MYHDMTNVLSYDMFTERNLYMVKLKRMKKRGKERHGNEHFAKTRSLTVKALSIRGKSNIIRRLLR